MLATRATMLNNYTRTAWRSLAKNKIFTLINILGLSAGIAAFLFINVYVGYERSYEGYNPNADNMLRVTLDIYKGSEYLFTDCETHMLCGQICKDEFPEVVDYVRMFNLDGLRHIQVAEKKFIEPGIYFADRSVFNLFAINIVQGDPQKNWNEPLQLVLSETNAKKFFGRNDIVGEQLLIEGKLCTVAGVMKDVPANTHLKFGMLMTHESVKLFKGYYTEENAWNGNNEYTYLLMQPGTDLAKFNQKLATLSEGKLKSKLKDGKYQAETIKSIHLYSNKSFEPEPNGNAKIVSFLSIISIIVIVIAWVNYMNLATARAIERAREVGIRKVMGSLRVQLIIQFLIESLAVNVASGFIGLAFFQLAVPLFKGLTGLPDITSVTNDGIFWVQLASIALVGTFLSGLYPAFVLSSFKPVAVLKGKFQSSSHGQLLRKGLVISQFATTMILITGVTAVYLQVKHMRTLDIGAKLDQTISIMMPRLEISDSVYNSMLGPLKSQVMQNPAVKSVTMADAVPGISTTELNSTSFSLLGKEQEGEYEYFWYEVDADFVKTMGMTMAAGRDFEKDPEFGNVLINEETSNRLGFLKPEDAIGAKLSFYDWRTKQPAVVVGVVKNFYQLSPKEDHVPMMFVYNTQVQYLAAHLETEDMANTLAGLKATWSKVFPGEPFTYFFVDDHFEQQFRSDIQFGQVMGTFTLLAVIIACLGLFGLSSYTILQRRKEIGIRKVLGANVTKVVRLLSGSYVKVVLMSSLLALPIAWFAVDNWLAAYTTRIELNVWMFVIPALSILLLALVTVSFQTIRSALVNPAISLKDE